MKVMEKPLVRSMDSPDEVRRFDKGRLELVKFGESVVGRATFLPGWRWSTSLKETMQTKSCEGPHFLYQLSGRMAVVMDDGTKLTCKPGDVVSIPPGHDAWVEGDEPVTIVDFQGMKDYAKPPR